MDPQVNQLSLTKVNDDLCCQSCLDKVILSKSQYSELLEDLHDLKRSKSVLARSEKALKEKVEAQKKDISRLQSDLSVKSCHHIDAKDKIQELSDEIEKLRAKYNDSEFSFKKFESASQIVKNLLDQQLHGNNKRSLGLGYKSVPPPFKDNYTSMSISEEEIAKEKQMTYGPKIVFENVENESTKETDCVGKGVNVTSDSETSAEEVKDDELKPSNSKFVPSVFQSHASGNIKFTLNAESTPYIPQQCHEREGNGFANENHSEMIDCIALNGQHMDSTKFERPKIVDHQKPKSKTCGFRKGEVKRYQKFFKQQKFQMPEPVEKSKVAAPKDCYGLSTDNRFEVNDSISLGGDCKNPDLRLTQSLKKFGELRFSVKTNNGSRLVLGRLMGIRLRVIAPDFRGYGLSDAPSEPEKACFTDLVNDIASILGSVAISKAFVVAKDFGGWVAYAFALLHPHKVAGIITSNVLFMPPGAFTEHFVFPEVFYVSRWQKKPNESNLWFGVIVEKEERHQLKSKVLSHHFL
ncbi:hypothetical protein E3N88_09524 [Mikania micrantha]|uniref:AB hydrolase-1 domain-containing protein n=1 Tax=Mikania micrantha TaxID=192012 RepID=A0A5N6PK74_9ASTR|nr:hypothetical protein E3N88_09524 [Mikania micrantha]